MGPHQRTGDRDGPAKHAAGPGRLPGSRSADLDHLVIAEVPKTGVGKFAKTRIREAYARGDYQVIEAH